MRSARASGPSAPVNSYIDLIDSGNLSNLTSSQPYDKQSYFQQYQKSFKDGEYNLQESVYTPMGQSIRRYMSGGIVVDNIPKLISQGMVSSSLNLPPVLISKNIQMNVFSSLDPNGTSNVKKTSSPAVRENELERKLKNEGLSDYFIKTHKMRSLLEEDEDVFFQLADLLKTILSKNDMEVVLSNIISIAKIKQNMELSRQLVFVLNPVIYRSVKTSILMQLVSAPQYLEENIVSLINLIKTLREDIKMSEQSLGLFLNLIKNSSLRAQRGVEPFEHLAEAFKENRLNGEFLVQLIAVLSDSYGGDGMSVGFSSKGDYDKIIDKILEPGVLEELLGLYNKLIKESGLTIDRINVVCALILITDNPRQKIAKLINHSKLMEFWKILEIFEKAGFKAEGWIYLFLLLPDNFERYFTLEEFAAIFYLDSYAKEYYYKAYKDFEDESPLENYFKEPKLVRIRYLLLKNDYSQLKGYGITLEELIKSFVLNNQRNIISQVSDLILGYQGNKGIISMNSAAQRYGEKFITRRELEEVVKSVGLGSANIENILRNEGYRFYVNNNEEIIIPVTFDILLSAYRGSIEYEPSGAESLTHCIPIAAAYYGSRRGWGLSYKNQAYGDSAFHEVDLGIMMMEGKDLRMVDVDASQPPLAFKYRFSFPEYSRKRIIKLGKDVMSIHIQRLMSWQLKERNAKQNIIKIFDWIEKGDLTKIELEKAIDILRIQLSVLQNECGLREEYFMYIFGALDDVFFLNLNREYSANTDNSALIYSLLNETMRGIRVVESFAKKDRLPNLIAHPWLSQGITVVDYLRNEIKVRENTFDNVDVSTISLSDIKNHMLVFPSLSANSAVDMVHSTEFPNYTPKIWLVVNDTVNKMIIEGMPIVHVSFDPDCSIGRELAMPYSDIDGLTVIHDIKGDLDEAKKMLYDALKNNLIGVNPAEVRWFSKDEIVALKGKKYMSFEEKTKWGRIKLSITYFKPLYSMSPEDPIFSSFSSKSIPGKIEFPEKPKHSARKKLFKEWEGLDAVMKDAIKQIHMQIVANANMGSIVKVKLARSILESLLGKQFVTLSESGYYMAEWLGTEGQFEAVIQDASSALVVKNAEGMSDIGGIAFNSLPIRTESVASSALGALPGGRAFKGDLDAEWARIQDVFNAGIRPSIQRLSEYTAAASASPLAQDKIDEVRVMLADILRRDEESQKLAPAEEACKQLLRALESA